MPLRSRSTPRGRRIRSVTAIGLAVCVVFGLAAAGVAWYGTTAANESANHASNGNSSGPAHAAVAQMRNAAAQLPNLPTSLAGSSAPRLPLDAGGHLAKSRAVRDFFDYCLSAQSDLSSGALDALVKREIAAQLDGTAAQAEALDVWQRYRAYLAALASLPDGGADSAGKLDIASVQLALDQREAIASRTLGEWSAPFFGAELQHQRYALARLKIARNSTLTEAQKAQQLAALDQSLSPEERATKERVQRQQAAISQIAQLQESGASPEETRAQLTQTLGPEAAQRVVQMEQEETDWRDRYASYAAQRAQIEAQGLTPQVRDAQIAQLRQRVFTRPGEALRAASLDGGGGSH